MHVFIFSSSTTGFITFLFVPLLSSQFFPSKPWKGALAREAMVPWALIVYFKGQEFAVKRVRTRVVDMHIVYRHLCVSPSPIILHSQTHFCQTELDILASMHHDNILPFLAVMMSEEDPQRPSHFLCYRFMPRMSGDLQSYLTKMGHNAPPTS